MTPAQIVAELSDLEEEDVREALAYWAAVLSVWARRCWRTRAANVSHKSEN